MAQISVNSSDFISSADTVLVSAVTDFQNIDYQTTGTNQVWDFSWVIIDSQRVDTYGSVSNSGFIYQLTFNNAFLNPNYLASYYIKADANVIPAAGGGGLPVTIENPIAFQKISNSKFENVGIGVELNGISVPIQADTIDVVYEFPMTFQDNWQSNSYLYFDVNPAFNAIFKRHQNRSSVVDGYGSITTTFGTFDCIRVKSDLTYIDSIYIDLFGTGGSWIGLPSQPETEYRWIAKDKKIPVFSINVAGGAITKVEFRDKSGVAGIKNNDLGSDVSVFPNPTKNNIFLSDISSYESINVMNMNGQTVYYESNINNNSLTIDCSQWERGIYILKVATSEKTTTKKIVLI